jgi:hypothetical protein
MSSNYPPGVTGNEYAIAGARGLGATSREVTCPSCGYEGDAEGELEGYDYEVWFAYECPKCDTLTNLDLDPEDFGPDPDDARDAELDSYDY